LASPAASSGAEPAAPPEAKTETRERWRATVWFRKGQVEWEAGKAFRFQGAPEEAIERAARVLRLLVDAPFPEGTRGLDGVVIQFLVSKPRQKGNV
jgi:hypothetical protein